MVSCGGCRYWEQEENNPDWGVCRRNAPAPAVTSSNAYAGHANFRAVWPYTRSIDGCARGEKGEPLKAKGPQRVEQSVTPETMAPDSPFNKAVETAREQMDGGRNPLAKPKA